MAKISPQNIKRNEEAENSQIRDFNFYLRTASSCGETSEEQIAASVNKHFNDEYVLCEEVFILSELEWKLFENLPNLFYYTEFENFMKITDFNKEIEKIYVIYKSRELGAHDNALICRTFFIESNAINCYNYVLKICIQITEQEELLLVKEKYDTKYRIESRQFVQSNNWSTILELPNLNIVTENGLFQAKTNANNQAFVHVVCNFRKNGILVHTTYKPLNEFEITFETISTISEEEELEMVNKQIKHIYNMDGYVMVYERFTKKVHVQDLPNLFVVSKEGPVKINNQESVDNGVLIISLEPLYRQLTLRKYLPKSSAIKEFDYILKISTTISDEKELEQVNQYFKHVENEEYSLIKLKHIDSVAWDEIKEELNLLSNTSEGLVKITHSYKETILFTWFQEALPSNI